MVANGEPVPLVWQRYSLFENGELQEHRVRAAAARIAWGLAGGTEGFSCDYGEHAGTGADPFGHFKEVTEGRQRSWHDSQGKRRRYSACEDLAAAVYFRLIGAPKGDALELMHDCLDWCNREEAGNTWVPGKNLLRLKDSPAKVWALIGLKWTARLGDALQVFGSRGPHTMIVTALQHSSAGVPVAIDHADYGQWHRPPGASAPGPSCRCYRGELLTASGAHWVLGGKRMSGWVSGGRKVHGRVDCVKVVEHVLKYVGSSEMLDALVPV